MRLFYTIKKSINSPKIMKHSLLHITNGDYTTQRLQKLTIEGDIITWREMLCEGKTSVDVGSENFWKIRFDFLKDSYTCLRPF